MKLFKYLSTAALAGVVFVSNVSANQRDFEMLDEYIQDGSPHYSVACNHNNQTIQVKVEQGAVIKIGNQCESQTSQLGEASFVEVINELCACSISDEN